MPTLESLLTEHDLDVLEHLDMQAEVPLVDFGRQGDVAVIPDRIVAVAGPATAEVPRIGVPVVRGENGGNTHAMFAWGGPVYLDLITGQGQDIAVMTVPAGSEAHLHHPQHGLIRFTPGDYTIRRQREQADEIRLVAD